MTAYQRAPVALFSVEASSRGGRFHLIRVSPGLMIKRSRGKQKLREEGCCRMCRRPAAKHFFDPKTHSTQVDMLRSANGSRILSGHHMVPKRWFRYQTVGVKSLRDVDANIVPLCRVCHDIETSETALRTIARRELRKLLAQEEVAFVIQVRGKAWFDHHYPQTRVV